MIKMINKMPMLKLIKYKRTEMKIKKIMLRKTIKRNKLNKI